jgi:hypothetical protein
VRWKRNGDGRVAPKGRTRYFLFQPWLPLIQATLVRGAFGVPTPARPVHSLLLACLFRLLLMPCLSAIRYFRQNFSYSFDIGTIPRSNFDPADDLGCRCRHFFGCNVSIQRCLANPKFLGSLSRRISAHFWPSVPDTILCVKCKVSRSMKHLAQNGLRGRNPWCHRP